MPINRLISIIDEQSMLRFFVIIDFIDYQFLSIINANTGWQGGRVVRVLDFESVGPGFESHSEHFMDLFLGCPEF